METTCNSIATNVSFASLFCKGCFSSVVSHLMILKKFNSPINLKKVPNIKEVLWFPPATSGPRLVLIALLGEPRAWQVVVEFLEVVMLLFRLICF